jgi:LysM repeat protein
MCQYAADQGQATDWHLAHWTSLLNSGAGLVTLEATAVTPEGRITPRCLGLWDDATAAALHDTLSRARKLAPQVPVAIQLAHAGRKASSATPWDGGQLIDMSHGGWPTLAPSALPHLSTEIPPTELDTAGIERLQQAFVRAAERAAEMDIEMLELHGAHGYLLHQFLSPISNRRTDAYGGSFENRTRFVRELFDSVRAKFKGVLGIRLSATDWVEGGWNPEEAAELLGMPVAQLRSVNDIPPRMMITAGSTLLVHRKGQLDKDVTEHLADNGQLGLAPEMVLKRILVKARKGDSLASLAARHGVSEANMAAWNKLKVNTHLASGQTLTLLVPSQGARRVTRPSSAKSDPPKPAQTPRKKTNKTAR